jgi:hypothetical protein
MRFSGPFSASLRTTALSPKPDPFLVDKAQTGRLSGEALRQRRGEA